MNLSKSKYCNAVQCPKMLWLSKNKKEVYDESVLNQAVLEQGSEVGDLAMGLFGDYVEVPFSDLSDMLAETNRLMEDETEIIAEASFAFNGLFCSVDILKNKGNGHVELYEVKSSSEVHKIYYDDVAYQCYVLKKLGYVIDRASIVHINTSYVRNGKLDLAELFVIVDVTTETRRKLDEVDSNINWLESYMKQKEEPVKDISMDCFEPYQCGFFNYCTKHLPSPNVFDIARLSKKKKFEYYNKGFISFKKLYDEKVLTRSYLPQVEHEVLGLAADIDVNSIRNFMSALYYPIYFLDFETFSSAIPPYENSYPYQQIPFQYSLHYIESENASLQHREFLAEAGADPRRALAERLCSDIPKNVCVTAYNMGFEKGRIRELAENYPDLSEHLMNIHDNIVDLMIPFQKKQYYQKEMQGSYSIKYVLPALFPDDPELNYSNLNGVHNGAEASNTFRKMVEMSPVEVVKCREDLLNYCKLDTYAMVKIWQKLNEIIGVKQQYHEVEKRNLFDENNTANNSFMETVVCPRKGEFTDMKKERIAKVVECPNCKATLNQNAKFCDQCGAKVIQIVQQNNFERNEQSSVSAVPVLHEVPFEDFGPLPTKMKSSNIEIVAKSKFDSEWISQNQFEVKKSNMVAHDKEKDNFKYQVAPPYNFYCRNEHGTRVPYTHLQGIHVYLLYDKGILFIKNGQLYDLNTKEKKYKYIADVKGFIHKIDLEGQNVVVERIKAYRKIVENKEIIDSDFGVIGHKDLYEAEIEKIDVGYKVNVAGGTSNAELSGKYSYWKNFVDYVLGGETAGDFRTAGFTLPAPADRNWYALRLGTSKARIELQINTKNNMIRTALFIKDEMMWDRLKDLLAKKHFDANKIHIDIESKTPSISLYRPIEGMNVNEKGHYDWYIESAFVLKKLYDVVAK